MRAPRLAPQPRGYPVVMDAYPREGDDSVADESDPLVPKYVALMEQRWADILEGTRQIDGAGWLGDHAQAMATRRRVTDAQERLGRQLIETSGLFTWIWG